MQKYSFLNMQKYSFLKKVYRVNYKISLLIGLILFGVLARNIYLHSGSIEITLGAMLYVFMLHMTTAYLIMYKIKKSFSKKQIRVMVTIAHVFYVLMIIVESKIAAWLIPLLK